MKTHKKLHQKHLSDCEKHVKITRKHSDRQHSGLFLKLRVRHRAEGVLVYATQFTQFTQFAQLVFKNEINFEKPQNLLKLD